MTALPARCCGTCAHWWEGGSLIATELRNPLPRDGYGACHFGPPTPVQTAPGRVEGLWPCTVDEAVCSQWEEREDDPDDPDDGERVGGEVVPIHRAAA